MNSKVSYFLVLITIVGYSKVESLSKLKNAQQSHRYAELSESETNALALKSNINEFNRVLSKILVPRVVGTPQHKKVANFISKELKSLGWHVERDQFKDITPTFGELQFENIIAKLNPNADRFLVLACHYDSKYMREYNFVGATDSAVPCSMMLNLAKVMQSELNSIKDRDDVSLSLVFFDGEEAFRSWSATDSIYGARNLAAKWENMEYLTKDNEITNHLNRIDILMLLDLIGEPNPKFYSYFAETQPWYGRLVDIEGRLADMGRLKNYNSKYFESFNIGAHIEDDHLPFMKRGTPILHIIPTPFPKNWHKSTDNRLALDMDTIENLNKIFRVFVAEYLHIKT